MAQKVTPQNFYLRTPREMDFRVLHGSCQSPQVPIASKVWVESTEKGFLTIRPLLHKKNGKNCKNANIGAWHMVYGHIAWAVVSLLKYTYYGSCCPLDP